MITVIVPHARPSLARVLGAFRRQTYTPRRLVVVENGPALGSSPACEATILRCPVAHVAAARNAGLAWLRANGGGPWAMFDDDDYYGPGYLAEVARELEQREADVLGKPWAWVSFDSGLYRFRSALTCNAPALGTLTGGTLAARSSECDYPTNRDDDDVGFCELMRERGARLWASSPGGYCYNRRGSAPRACPMSELEARRAFGDAEWFGDLPDCAVDDEPTPEPIAFVPMPTDEAIARAMLLAEGVAWLS